MEEKARVRASRLSRLRRSGLVVLLRFATSCGSVSFNVDSSRQGGIQGRDGSIRLGDARAETLAKNRHQDAPAIR